MRRLIPTPILSLRLNRNGSDPFQVDIFVTDSTGVGLSFASIIQRVPGFNVEVSIQVPQATASRRYYQDLGACSISGKRSKFFSRQHLHQ